MKALKFEKVMGDEPRTLMVRPGSDARFNEAFIESEES